MPEISVVIPTRNRWDLLTTSALPSALAQEGVTHEVIVVDDGSLDGTARRLESLGDARLRVVRHEVTLGLSRARNTGIEAARGEWISFLDDDDLWAPTKLSVQLAAARAARAAFAYGASVVLDEQGRVMGEHRPPHPTTLASELRRRYTIPAGCSNVLLRTELARELGGFDVELWHLQDWDLWIRLARAGAGVAVDEVLVGYVLHGMNSFLGDATHDIVDDLAYLVSKYGAGPDGLEIDAAGFTRWVAFRLRASGQRRRAARTYLRCALAHRTPGDALRAMYALVEGRGLRRAHGETAVTAGPELPAAPRPAWLDAYASKAAVSGS